jgi:hypothetical protein
MIIGFSCKETLHFFYLRSAFSTTWWIGLLIAGGIISGISLLIVLPTVLGIVLTRNPSGKMI